LVQRNSGRSTVLRDLFLDIERALLLIWVLLTTAVPLFLRRLVTRDNEFVLLGARLRRSFQRLGITYIKLGQFLAMRFDLLPQEVCRELAGLFDSVPPMSTDDVRRTLELEFGQPTEKLFSSFDWECIAAASVAQVHRAITREGAVVAVKIQRPRISRIFAADIRNFRRLARLGDYLQAFGPQSIVAAVNEFERYTRREMDFLTEGRTAERLRNNAGPGESAPRVYWELTTTRVLTTELVEGYPLSEIIQLIEAGRQAELETIAPGLDFDLALHNFAWACLRQLFITGFFHADPHPGNIFLRKDGTVVFVDFGIFGQLSPQRRETFASYIENLSFGNVAQSYQHFIRLLQPTIHTDLIQLRRDVYGIMRRWHKASQEPGASIGELHLGTYFGEFISAIRRNKVQMSMDTLLFWRAILTLDATALRFGNQFDLLQTLREFFIKTRPSPLERILDLPANKSTAKSFLRLEREAPQEVNVFLDSMARGTHEILLVQNKEPGVKRFTLDEKLIGLTLIAGSTALLLNNSTVGVIGQTGLWLTTLSLAAAILTMLIRR
jgi:ubiquinone biosynthesis protein